MSANLPRALNGASLTPALANGAATLPALHTPSDGESDGRPAPTMAAQVARVVEAVNRFKWLILVTALLGVGGGVVASRLVEPMYVVQASILITSPVQGSGGTMAGPIRDQQVLDPQGWTDLLRTNIIADSVVMKLALYVEPEKAKDSTAFSTFQLKEGGRFYPGEYTLTLAGPRYTLRDKLGVINEQGIVGDSIGRGAGFAWAPTRAQLGADRTVKFRVRVPREVSNSILQRMGVGLAQGSNLIFLRLSGNAQQKPAETLNEWQAQFVRMATGLKNSKFTQAAKALTEQREIARQQLAEAERRYEQFRVGAITEPSDNVVVGSGAGGAPLVATDPSIANYASTRYQLDALRRARQQLEAVAARVSGDSLPVIDLLSNPVVTSDPAAGPLRVALNEVMARDAELRALRLQLQETAKPVQTKLEQRRTLSGQIVPREMRELLVQLRQREKAGERALAQSGGELKAIPQRTTVGEALRRDKDQKAALFSTLDSRFQEAQLAEQSMTPDVRVLDTAVMPATPTENTLPRLIALGLAGGLALGLGAALLLDRLDRRFRYPMQVTHGLGLQVLGVVPEIDQTRRQSPERVAQIVEAFRSLRMNLRYACMPSPRVTLTVTSPGPNDGKSIIASNLALSFAEGGWRTVLIDGDLRRGQLNATFDLPSGPGLVEYLEGTSLLGEVVQPTTHDNLSVVTTGTKHRRGPELLGTPRMQQLIAALAAEYDAVLVDSPPLGAGADAYALAAATTNVALVLRRAATDVRMAEAKLQALDALPVQVLGAVLNEVKIDGTMYQYYSYDPDYVLVESGPDGAAEVADGADVAQLPAGR